MEVLTGILKGFGPIALAGFGVLAMGLIAGHIFAGGTFWKFNSEGKKLENQNNTIFSQVIVAVGIFLILFGVLSKGTQQNNQSIIFLVIFIVFAFKANSVLLGRKTELEKLQHLIVQQVEDATRRVLKGFFDVFERAQYLVDNADKELYYINFLFHFGLPQTKNKELNDLYPNRPRAKETPLEQAVENLYSDLRLRMQQIEKVRILTTDPEVFHDKVSDAFKGLSSFDLSDENKYEPFKVELQQKYNSAIDSLFTDHTNCKKNESGRETSFQFKYTKEMPIQMIIAGLKDKKSNSKYGCLVFMVNSSFLKGSKKYDIRGFYTELDEVIDVYRNFADNLMANENNKPQIVCKNGSCEPYPPIKVK
ncbi:MAG: hypothetical protein QNL04_10140 [SAR324 cluster bacterium]|nr:hypothetical protein [SAR324 cluster bacterium]